MINNVISNTAPAAEPAGTMDPGTDLATDPTTDPTTNPTTEPPVIVSQDSPAVTPGLTTTPPVTDIKNAGDGYRNGSYTGSGDGYCSQINVTVNIVNNRIDTVVIDSQRESKPKKSLKAMPERIVDAQSADVAVVSGATYTSRGILDAVRDALSKARAD